MPMPIPLFMRKAISSALEIKKIGSELLQEISGKNKRLTGAQIKIYSETRVGGFSIDVKDVCRGAFLEVI